MKYFPAIRYALFSITGILLLLASCTPATQKEDDLALIETIENSLLPSIIFEGQDTMSYNILERMKNYSIPGLSIAFLNGGEIVWAKGYGFTTRDSSNVVDEHTLFQAASISKPVAAMAALYLVEEGKMELDENVNVYLADWQVEENAFTQEEKVTLRRLLSHSAGLTVHGFGGYSHTEELPDVVQILNGEAPANSGRIYPDTIPGSIYRYSGGGYTVMQKMLTDIMGKDFPVLMEEIVLSKIDMQSSTYRQPLPGEYHKHAAAGHLTGGETIEGNWHSYPEMAAAGLWTTPTDLLKYAREVQLSYAGESNKVLSKEMVQKMLTPQMNSHGLGPGIGGRGEDITFGHGGSNAGFRCQLVAFAKKGQGVAVMTNGDMGGYLMDEVLRSFSKVYEWGIYKPETKKLWPMEEAELESFAGKYLLNYYGQELVLELSAQDGYLKGHQLWDNLLFQIYPESGKSFFNPEDGVGFVFQENSEGGQQMIVKQFGQEYSFQKL